MALNIKNAEVERLASDVASATGESKTEAIRKALLERKSRLQAPYAATRARRKREFLERELWPLVPPKLRGKRLSKKEEDSILGYDRRGV